MIHLYSEKFALHTAVTCVRVHIKLENSINASKADEKKKKLLMIVNEHQLKYDLLSFGNTMPYTCFQTGYFC